MRYLAIALAVGVATMLFTQRRRPTAPVPFAERKLRSYYDSLGAEGEMARGMLRGAGYNV